MHIILGGEEYFFLEEYITNRFLAKDFFFLWEKN